jgi:hypothetical protein
MARDEAYEILVATLFHMGRLTVHIIYFCAKKGCLEVPGTAHPAHLLGRHSAHIAERDLFCGNVFGSPIHGLVVFFGRTAKLHPSGYYFIPFGPSVGVCGRLLRCKLGITDGFPALAAFCIHAISP